MLLYYSGMNQDVQVLNLALVGESKLFLRLAVQDSRNHIWNNQENVEFNNGLMAMVKQDNIIGQLIKLLLELKAGAVKYII